VFQNAGGVGLAGSKANVSIQNSIVWGNWYGVDPLPSDPVYIEPIEVTDWFGTATWSVRNTCLPAGGLNLWRGINGNVNDDPSYKSLELGDLSLGDQSPCIDRGNTFVDLDPLLPGFQQLPELDLAGEPRIVDGNGDGVVAVDMGAFEAPEPH
jgi:hypothetical protein